MGRKSHTVSDAIADLSADCDSSRYAPVDVVVELGGDGAVRFVRFTVPGAERVTWSFGRRVVREHVSIATGLRTHRYYRGSPVDAEVRRVLEEKLSFTAPPPAEARGIDRR